MTPLLVIWTPTVPPDVKKFDIVLTPDFDLAKSIDSIPEIWADEIILRDISAIPCHTAPHP